MQYIQLQPQNPSTIITPGEGHYNLFLDETDLGFKIKNSEDTLLPVSDTYITGGTFSDDTLTLTDNLGNNVDVTGITSGGMSELVVSVTYEELVDKITGSTLVPGQHYLINDFRTCYDQPDYNSNGTELILGNYKVSDIDPIIVLAISGNTIDVNAYQPSYPKDKIKYDWTYNVTEATGNVAYGRITERIDDRNNRTDYDHRTILFKRYKNYLIGSPQSGLIVSNSGGNITGENTLFLSNFSINDIVYIVTPFASNFYKVTNIISNTSMTVVGNNYDNFNYDSGLGAKIYKTSGVVYDSHKPNNIPSDNASAEYKTFNDSEQVVNNYIGDYANHYSTIGLSSFMLSNNVIISWPAHNNNIGSTSINNTFSNTFSDNEIGVRFQNNNVRGSFTTNKIGTNFNRNFILFQFGENVVSDVFELNVIFDDFYKNEISNNFNRNAVINEFYENKISFNFENNYCFQSFYNNVIDVDFQTNQILGQFIYNNIGMRFIENHIFGFFYGNKIGSFFQNNTASGSFSNNNIGDEFINNQVGSGFGYGGDQNQGNLIGNYFYNNEIGEYFYNNTIGNYFRNNKVHDNFQWNDVKTEINNQDFTVYKGVIDTFGYTTNIVTSLSDGYYTGVVGEPQGGIEGNGAVFAVNVIGNTVASLGISDYGHLYEVGNQIILNGSDFGGSVSDTITVTVTGLESTPSVYETTTSNIFEIRGGEKRVSYYNASNVLTVTKEWEDGPPLP